MSVWRPDAPIPLPEPFTLDISLPSVVHHPGNEPGTGERSRACECGFAQYAPYGEGFVPAWHWCPDSAPRRFVYWKKS
jgi:hypothetical protein